jgi:hypothetical protein
MSRSIILGIAWCAFSLSAFAQDTNNLVGKWSGSHTFASAVGQINIRFELEITSVEGNTVKGTAKYYGRACAGDYVMTGKLNGNNLGMISTNSGGPTGDCKFGFRATVDGNKMTGKTGPNDLTASKQ